MSSKALAWTVTIFGLVVFCEGLLFLWLEYFYWPRHPLI